VLSGLGITKEQTEREVVAALTRIVNAQPPAG
jgi:hypothetical protein